MDTPAVDNRLTTRNVVIFTLAVLALGWLGLGLDALMGNPPSQGIGQLIWILSPLGVSFLLRAFAGDGWRDLGIRPSFGKNALWYVVSLLSYPVIATLVILIAVALGAATRSDSAIGLFAPAVAAAFVPLFVKNIFEEFGWRGYLAPKLYSLGGSVLLAHGLVGLIWGVWHVPYYLAFLDRAVLGSYTTQSLATLIPLVILGAIAASIVYGEIRLLTDSVWPAVLMHTVGNAFVNTLLLGSYVKLADGGEFLFSPGVEGLLTIVLFALLGFGIHWRRMST